MINVFRQTQFQNNSGALLKTVEAVILKNVKERSTLAQKLTFF